MSKLDPEALVRRIRAEHECAPGALEAQISAAERSLGAAISQDLRALLLCMNGAAFWENGDFPYRLLAVEEMAPVWTLFGKAEGSPSLVAILQAQGDYVCLDLASAHPSRAIYCAIETFPFELRGVCESVWEMMSMIVESGGREWLWPAVLAYGKKRGEL